MALATSEQFDGTQLRLLAVASTYAPLIVGLVIVISATYLLELLRSAHGVVFVHELMNAFMGFFFVLFAVPKFFNLAGFAEAFKQYDSISQKYFAYAKAFPFIELGLGLVLLSNYTTNSSVGNKLVNIVIIFITAATLLGVVRSLRQKKKLVCACMGTIFNFPLSKVALFENGIMLLMALGMLFFQSSFHVSVVSLTHFWIMHG